MSGRDADDVDELAVAAASGRLDRLAVSCPKLLGEPSATNIEEWIAIIVTDEKGPHMAKSAPRDEQFAFRFPEELVKRIDRYRAALAEGHPPGLDISRSYAVRTLLALALDAVEKDEKGPKRRGGKAGT